MIFCPLCKGQAESLLQKEANVSCGDYFEGRRLYPENIGEFTLMSCQACGFAWYPEFAAWTDSDFQSRIYNDLYHLCDAPFLDDRPNRLAAWLIPLIGARCLLDFGGGEGQLAQRLIRAGKAAVSYDPYYGDRQWPEGKFDIVTAFEVVEHVPDQFWLFDTLASFLAPHGLIVFSTLLRPEDMGEDWWYASPRNGHVAFHSPESLAAVCSKSGLTLQSLSREMHIASTDPASLEIARHWPAPSVNDRVAYHFAPGWQTLHPLPGRPKA
jgi:SAM-dependent methyltransferase